MAFLTRTRRSRRAKPAGNEQNRSTGGRESTVPSFRDMALSSDLDANLDRLKEIFRDCSDIVFREFLFAQKEQIRLALVYTDGLADKSQVSEQIMRALSLEVPVAAPEAEITRANALHFVKMRGLCIHQVRESARVADVVDAVLSGDTVLLVDGHAVALINGARGWEMRSIQDSQTEVVVRGPRESFIETLRVNTSLIRRKIKNPNLKIEMFKLGEVTRTDVALVYIKGIASVGLVAEARNRLARIKIDGVLESGYIEELVQDDPYTPFALLHHTDRPDRVAAYLLEGRVAILVDGTPVVLLAPTLFIESIQTPEDYYEKSQFMTAIRMLRLLALFLSLTAPSFYVAIISFHHEMLPTALLLSIAAQREAVPLPVFVETLLMEIAFELIRETGIRLPRPIGMAVSIVAALIIGEAAVQAGMVAAATVIVVALAAIASFAVYYSGSVTVRLLRFFVLLLTSVMGLLGLMTGIILIVTHMASLRSFGIPYLYPVAPLGSADMKDVIVRAPWWAMFTRPGLISKKNRRRMAQGLKPEPPADGR
ncbi:MAG: spore germination protein [Peptococcaceae bacterium]|nr:MAG: spore germination protein [Peptococcaceae bacterium]